MTKQRILAVREQLVRLSMVLALGFGVYYIGWRLFVTLNPQALWFAIPVWAAEAYGLVSGALFFFMTWSPRHRQRPGPPPPGLNVDVFIPTYNEPAWIVRRTLLGALAITYPHATYLLDDGNRLEMRVLAKALGANYLTREDNQNAKAGNLNHALEHSKGDLIAIFDADNVPMPDFLDATLAYFEDSRVAFVQTPQDFYNINSFQHRPDIERRSNWHEQALFYSVIQPGKDRWNSAFFCGSCAVVRRVALESIGGFATGTVTEDIHTSIRMHSKRWKSVYHEQTLGYGIAPQNAPAYHSQRLRWGQGAMQVFVRDNPLLIKGLTLAQRINYLASMITYFDSYQKVVFYIAPALALVTGILPIVTPGRDFLVRFGLYYTLSIISFKLASRGHGMSQLTEAYSLARVYTYLKSTAGLFARDRLKFKVTDKETADRIALKTAAPALVVLTWSTIGLVVGVTRLALGREIGGPLAFGFNVGWALWQAGLALWVTRLTLETIDVRRIHRAPGGFPVHWSAEGRSGVGIVLDFHEEGARILVHEWPDGALKADLDVNWGDVHIESEATVLTARSDERGTVVSVMWRPQPGRHPAADLSVLVMMFAHRKLLTDIGRPRDRWGALDIRGRTRRERRRLIDAPVRLSGDDTVWGVLEDLSPGGALLLLPVPIAPMSTVRISPWGETTEEGVAVRVTRLDLPPYSAYRVGLRFPDGHRVSDPPRPAAPTRRGASQSPRVAATLP
jgi:cellulose synthase (UDP-forming)